MSYKQKSPIPVIEGGTGAITLTDHGVLVGSGTGAVTPLGVGITGYVLVGSTAADPAFAQLGVNSSLTANGVLIGQNNSAITATAVGNAGEILTSNGVGLDPTFQPAPGGSISITGDAGGALVASAFTFTGGTTGLTFSGAGSTETLTGTLAIANGGTNATSMAVTDGTVYFDGTSLVTTATGTAGQVLTSAGAGVAPAYATPAASSISITGDTGGALVGAAFTFSGGTTGLSFGGAGSTETLTFAGITANGGAVNLGTDNAGNAIAIGTGTVARNINIGLSAAPHVINIGVNNGASSLGLNAGTGDMRLISGDEITLDAAGVLEINSTGGTISIGNDANAQAIDIGTGAAARTITVGNVTTSTGLVLNSGTGGVAINTTGAGDVVVTSADTVLIDSAGVLELNSSAGVISIGNDAVNQNINLGTAGTRTINIGSATATIDIGGFAEGALVTSNAGVVSTVTGTAGFVLTANAAGTAPSFQAAGSGMMSWTELTGASEALAVDNGYIMNRATAITATLPGTAAVGSIIEIAGKGAGLTIIAQNAGQTIHFGNQNTTTGAGGTLTATNQYDTLRLLAITANTDFVVLSSVGNWTVV